MRILVDADACPVKELILREAKRRSIPVLMIHDTSHELSDGYSQSITVDKGADSADLKLINLLSPGVAAMALGKGAAALSQNGLIYTSGNIDRLLFERHVGKKLRRAGKHGPNPKKRTSADDDAFLAAFLRLLGPAC